MSKSTQSTKSQSTKRDRTYSSGYASTVQFKGEKVRRFLDAMTEQGNVAAGCRAAGIDRRTAYNWRADDEDFAKAWDDALQNCLDSLEGALFDRGRTQSDRAAFGMLKAHRRDVYGDTIDITSAGQPIDLGWPEQIEED